MSFTTMIGEFHERKVLAFAAGIGFLLAIWQATMSPVNALFLSGVTVIGTILGDMYWCKEKTGPLELEGRLADLLFYGTITLVGIGITLIPSLFFLASGAIIAFIIFQLWQRETFTEDDLFSLGGLGTVAVLFFVISKVPELLLLPVGVVMVMFVATEYPGGDRR